MRRRCAAAVGREVRFFTAAGVVALIYALGWYTPVFRVLYELVPGVGLFRRPADATFLIGALAAILAGYAAHRLFKDPLTPWEPRAVAIASVLVAAAIASAIALGLWLDRMGRLPLPLAAAALSFAGAAVALSVARARMALKPMLSVGIVAAFTTADLAYNNGPNGATALPPAAYDVLEPGTRNATIAILKDKVVRGEVRRDPSSSPGSASTGPTPASPTGWRTRSATIRCASASTVPPPGRGTTSGCRTSARSRRCFPPIALGWPICWACASSSRACRSRPSTAR
jgi:4-amino-4-deoxy-L-arabinose transferase-like glycosyltransferase